MHHNNFGNFYTREIYVIPIPIMSRMAVPIPMGMGNPIPTRFPWEWDSYGVSHSHAHFYTLYALSDIQGSISQSLSANTRTETSAVSDDV